MFSGSKYIENFDYFTQMCGGENNAFTNNDITNFYLTLPAENLEMAFCLESDRMENLIINQKKFKTEKKVVIEEFKETTLNVPFGDMWHHISQLSYVAHPYKWPTIGKKIEDIEGITIKDVIQFYEKFYVPSNAIIAISGNFNEDDVIQYLEKWFHGIEKKSDHVSNIKSEPVQSEIKNKVIKSNVPSNAIYLAFHVDARNGKNYYTHDLISDILGRGRSSRLYQKLVKKKQYFTEIHAYLTGSNDPGLLIIEGLIADNVDIDIAEQSIFTELDKLKNELIENRELTKLKNKMLNQIAFEEINILYKAINLCQFEAIGIIDQINSQMDFYNEIDNIQIKNESMKIFDLSNCSKLIYIKEN